MTHYSAVWPLSPPTLAALPPSTLVNQRHERYEGGTFTVPLAVFAPADQQTLHTLYHVLGALWTVLTLPRGDRDTLAQALHTWRTTCAWPAVVRQVLALGTTAPDPALSLVIHDLRGGSLTALVGMLDLMRRHPLNARPLPALVALVRDHRHALRNLVPDLDPQGADRDHQPQPHPIEDLVAKWRSGSIRSGSHVAHVHLAVQEPHAVAARASELAAMDAVLTNLVNNAVRFTADGQVYVAFLPHRTGQDVRVVVSNRLTADHATQLHTHVGTDWTQLFAGTFTTGGTGLGLRIAAAYVTECYGLPSLRQAVARQYIAAAVRDQTFVAYFHWPLLPDAPAPAP